MQVRDELLRALEAVRGGAVEMYFFGKGVFTEMGENSFLIKDFRPTDSGILVDLSPEASEGPRDYVGYTLLKIYDPDVVRYAGERAFEMEARAVEYLRCTAYVEGRSGSSMFIDFRRSERLKDGQVQHAEFNSLGQLYSRDKVRTEAPALAVRGAE